MTAAFSAGPRWVDRTEPGTPVQKLLIAHAHSTVRLLLSTTLADENHAVLEARTGPQAIAMARAQRPAVAILDVRLPKMDGLQVCRSIKADPELAHIAVVMLAPTDWPEEVMAAGADAYVANPFNPVELLEIIELASRRGARQ